MPTIGVFAGGGHFPSPPGNSKLIITKLVKQFSLMQQKLSNLPLYANVFLMQFATLLLYHQGGFRDSKKLFKI